jgi:hypothetical protein
LQSPRLCFFKPALLIPKSSLQLHCMTQEACVIDCV